MLSQLCLSGASEDFMPHYPKLICL
jgi:hypothetical protein